MDIFEDIVNSETENMRFDRYLKKMCKNETMASIYRGLKKGDIRINDKKVKENYRLCLGDKIKIKFLNVEIEGKNSRKVKENVVKYNEKYFKDLIIYEEEDFFIVNKPHNIPMHKGTGHKYGLSEIYKDIFGENVNFANRLDYETRGLVIGCKNLKFLRYISKKIRENKVLKRYIAIVHGNIQREEFILENYLEIGENGVKVHRENKNNSKLSISKFSKKIPEDIKMECNIKGKTPLYVDLITGRKHQIRAQLSDAGYPIVGDKKYGIGDGSKIFYLCCFYISFDDYHFQLKEKIFDL